MLKKALLEPKQVHLTTLVLKCGETNPMILRVTFGHWAVLYTRWQH